MVAMAEEPLTVARIAEWVGGTVEGDGRVRIDSIAALDAAREGQLTFAADAKRAEQLADSRAACALVVAEAKVPAISMPLIRVEDVQAAMAKLLGALSRDEDLPADVHPSAVIAPDATEAGGAAGLVLVGSSRRIAPEPVRLDPSVCV